MRSYNEALEIVRESTRRSLPGETVPLVLAVGRVLAEPITAGENIPAAANSAMDGFALRAEDITEAAVDTPSRLRVIGEAAAGAPFAGTLGRGEAVRIMTGGMLPDGADAVVEVESTFEADGAVDIRRSVRPGNSIRKAGEDVQVGQEVIPAGKRITPADVGVMASLGVTNVPVRVKPIVGILSTGNEVVEAFRTPGPGQIRNSTAPALYAYCAEAGAEPIDLGIAGDDRDDLEEKLEQGLRYDILLTTGGVSAGAYDLVQTLLPEMGVEVRFHKVRIKPGKPILFGVFGSGDHETLVFGLPGNPVSTLVTFRKFVRESIAKLLGETAAPMMLRARLDSPIRKNDDKRHFVRGILSTDRNGSPVVVTTGSQSSGVMTSMSRANCLILIEEESGSLEPGAEVMVEML